MVRYYVHSLMVRYYIHSINYRFKYKLLRNGIHYKEMVYIIKKWYQIKLGRVLIKNGQIVR